MNLGKKTRKKCPVCGSTRFTSSEKGASCKKCGYTNKKEINNSEKLSFRTYSEEESEFEKALKRVGAKKE